jgi:hypothetical protein
MSVITEPAPVPNRLEVLVKYLRTRKDGETKARLTAVLSPAALQQGANDETGEDARSNALADGVLRAGQRLGITVVEGEFVRLAPHLEVAAENYPEALHRHLESTLLSASAPDDQRDVARTLAWFLIQDPAEPLQVGNVKQRVEDQLVASEHAQFSSLSNSTRFEQFTYWARYFGCAWRFKGKAEVVVPDPTGLLARYLPRLMQGNERISIQDLLARWRTPLPILEGGQIRDSVEEALRDPFRRPAEHLSRATSLALQRLRDQGRLRLERLADAPPLLLASWPDQQPISHVTWLGGAA